MKVVFDCTVGIYSHNFSFMWGDRPLPRKGDYISFDQRAKRWAEEGKKDAFQGTEFKIGRCSWSVDDEGLWTATFVLEA